LKDTFKHQGKRKQLVEKLKDKGIKDERVLDAINRIPRHLFMDSSFEDFAYQLFLLLKVKRFRNLLPWLFKPN
jgi:protein-L-isoaspartate(D-aspartate) O-methyltransferase